MSAPQEQRPRLVVVDDDRLIRELARDALEACARVECCADAESALQALGREPADVVVSDLTMPRMTGLDLLGAIRRAHPGTDFVLMTANASVESAISALRMGAADYLHKPLRPEELSHVVERILARRALIEENERLRDSLHTIESCSTLMRCLDPGELYAVALDLVLHTLRRERGMALFRRSSVPAAEGVAFRGFGEIESRRLRDLLLEQKPVSIDAVDRIDRIGSGPLLAALGDAGFEADGGLEVPIRGRESEAGVLWIFEQGEPFGDAALERAGVIARHAELALYNAERYNRAKERAFVDDVTEVYNARYLLQAAEHEIQRAARYGKELCVLFLDLDRFKLVNDRYGHLVGSQALRQLAQVLTQCIRQADTLARYGGDEFTILLADTDLETGRSVAGRIRRKVSETVFEGGRDAPIRLSISIGIACYPQDGETRDALLDQADKAMYRAKSLGRNCVCVAGELSD